jgi:hypothetical protein
VQARDLVNDILESRNALCNGFPVFVEPYDLIVDHLRNVFIFALDVPDNAERSLVSFDVFVGQINQVIVKVSKSLVPCITIRFKVFNVSSVALGKHFVDKLFNHQKVPPSIAPQVGALAALEIKTCPAVPAAVKA